jgi:hypothetical protein
MPDAYEVPVTDPNAKAGYTFDPYRDPCQLIDYWPPNYPFHNARQRHVAIVALVRGLRTTMWQNLPECPPLWQDIIHYWDGCTAIGYEIKSKGFAAVVAVVGVLIYQNPNIVLQVIPIAMKVFGA